MNFVEKIRFWIVKKIDKQYEEACWFNLCMWALGYHSFKETFLINDFNTNHWDYQYCKIREPDNCYCGKCSKYKLTSSVGSQNRERKEELNG